MLQRAGRLRLGRIAEVRRIIGSRKIPVDRANWLNRVQDHFQIDWNRYAIQSA